MKKIIAGMILTGLLISGNAFAQNTKSCKFLANMAEKVMSARQDNVPMLKLVENFQNSELPEHIIEGIVYLISMAYSTPRYSTERNKRNAAIDFQNRIFNGCIND